MILLGCLAWVIVACGGAVVVGKGIKHADRMAGL